MYYRGTIIEGPRTPRCQKGANPLVLCWIASAEGVRPLKMTSFLWVQRDQSVAKIISHSASRQNVPPPRDRQKASSEVPTRRLTPAAYHCAWARGQTKNMCEQSSTALAHKDHSTREFGTMRCRKDLVIRRRRRRSQVNTLIFRGRRYFHTKRHLCKKSGSSRSSWSRRSLYAAQAVKLGPLHTHSSWAAFDRHRSARSSCRLSSSATRWSGIGPSRNPDVVLGPPHRNPRICG